MNNTQAVRNCIPELLS